MIPNFLLAGVVLINFAVVNMGGLKLSALHLTFILLVGVVLLRIRRIELDKAITILLLLALPLINVYFVSDQLEFFKTFMTYTILLLTYFCVIPFLQGQGSEVFKVFYRRLLIVILVLQVFGIIQWAAANFLNNMSLYNAYLPFQFNGEQLIGTYKGIIRANSIFPEPSIFAIICNLSSALILAFNRLKKDLLFFILNLLCLVITFSSSSYLFYLLIVAVYLLVRRRYGLLAYGLGLLAIPMMLYSSSLLQVFRFSELYVPGTSGYYRVISPLLMLRDILLYHPATGIGIGQIDLVIPRDYSQYFVKSGKVGDTLDNSLILSLIVFGLPVLFVYGRVLMKYARRFMRQRLNLVLMAFLFSFLISTGLLFGPEFILILVICEWAMHQNVEERQTVVLSKTKEAEALSYPIRKLPLSP
ncbi:hypothetical protein [Paenibacillus glycanilyticus]|uniref:hypothetical protein n=1 Tax=Paenibacillus glycanilyticus TaxID=126569 RepID=UPI003EBC48C7